MRHRVKLLGIRVIKIYYIFDLNAANQYIPILGYEQISLYFLVKKRNYLTNVFSEFSSDLKF